MELWVTVLTPAGFRVDRQIHKAVTKSRQGFYALVVNAFLAVAKREIGYGFAKYADVWHSGS